MKTKKSNSRRQFVSSLTASAALAGIAMIPNTLTAEGDRLPVQANGAQTGSDLDAAIKAIGQKEYPVAYDISQANPWGIIWSNVYYLTNNETGTEPKALGVLNVLRHHGIIFAFNDQTILKYKLGEHFGFNDPATNKPTLRNPFYIGDDAVFPVPGLSGIKGLQGNGALFCVCDMARKVNAQFIAQKMSLKTEDVYADLVKGTLPGILSAPSGVWALGRLANSSIAYIDASVG
ncbi:Tat (twin-arginine translocation) pathway signal sequence containing protein [Roseivirga sp.]|nr:Tat (twin-arginine translocation) pathway signal sequence containing protein [Roseivirga sp.]